MPLSNPERTEAPRSLHLIQCGSRHVCFTERPHVCWGTYLHLSGAGIPPSASLMLREVGASSDALPDSNLLLPIRKLVAKAGERDPAKNQMQRRGNWPDSTSRFSLPYSKPEPGPFDKPRVRAPPPPPLSTIVVGSASAPQGAPSASAQSAGRSSAFREEYQPALSPSQSSFRSLQARLT